MNKSRHIRLPLVSLMVIVFLLVTTIAVNATPAEQEGTCFPAKSITWRPWEHGSYLRANVGNCTAYSQFRTVTSLPTGDFDTSTWTAQGCVNHNTEVQIGIPGSFVKWVATTQCKYNPSCIAKYYDKANWGVYASN